MEWISVKERLPDEKKAVLGYCFSENDEYRWLGFVQVYFSPNKGWSRCELYDPKEVYVTHWAILPEKPEI